jgi:hypothetical protein
MSLALALTLSFAAQGAPSPAAAAPAAAPAPAAITDGVAFCADTGPSPLAVVSVRGAVASVRVAPLVIALGEQAPSIVLPRHTDERWPLRTVSAACLTRTPPTLPEKRGVSVALLTTPTLVFGCRAGPVGAALVPGSLALADAPAPRDNACLTHLDVRPPCPRRDSEDDPTFDKRRKDAELDTRARLARLVPRYAHGGPALLVRAEATSAPGTLFLVERLLESEACGCAEDAAGVVSTRVIALRVPVLSAPALLSIAVPRYTGAAYDLVRAEDEEDVDADALTRLPYTDTFSAQPPDEERVVRVFSAPEACPCDCED